MLLSALSVVGLRKLVHAALLDLRSVDFNLQSSDGTICAGSLVGRFAGSQGAFNLLTGAWPWFAPERLLRREGGSIMLSSAFSVDG